MADKGKRQYQTSGQETETKWQQPEIDEDVASPVKIVDVDNDCLEHVFQYLSLMDLINVADANKHLVRAASTVFGRKYRGKTVHFKSSSKLSLNQRRVAHITDVDDIVIENPALAFKILRLFGSSISNIKLSRKTSKKLSKALLFYVNKYCSETLNSFALVRQDFTYTDAKKPYKNVEVVSIGFGKIGFKLTQFNETFPKMRRLNLVQNEFSDRTRFVGRFHQLEYLKIDFSTSTIALTIKDVKDIIRQNPQIQSLSVSGDISLGFLAYINNQLKQLKALELKCIKNYIWVYRGADHPISFEYVESLKLDIRSGYWNIRKVLSFKQLKECTITGYLDGYWMNFVIRNPTIEKLKVIGREIVPIYMFALVSIAKNLPKLTEFSMIGYCCLARSVNHFLSESQSIRKFSCEIIFPEDDHISPDWNVTRIGEITTIERK